MQENARVCNPLGSPQSSRTLGALEAGLVQHNAGHLQLLHQVDGLRAVIAFLEVERARWLVSVFAKLDV